LVRQQLRGDWNLTFHRLLQKVSFETTMADLGLQGSLPSPSVPIVSSQHCLSSLNPGPFQKLGDHIQQKFMIT
jgi:hypothetical protein